MRKYSALASVALFGLLMGANVVTSDSDIFSKFGAVVVLMILCTLWGLGVNSFSEPIPWTAYGTTLIFLIILSATGGDLITRVTQRATPLATVEIDRSVVVMPWPENPDPQDQETIEWMRQKTGITWSDFFEVSIFGNLIGATSIWLSMTIGWIMLKMPWPEKVKRFTIPFEVVLFFVTIGSLVWVIYSPITSVELDEVTRKGLNTIWWLGFTKGWWYPTVFTVVGIIINWVNTMLDEGSENQELPKQLTAALGVTGMLLSTITAFALAILSTTTDPTTIAWKVCSDVFLDTAATNSLCFKSNQAGLVAMFYLSMVWGWIISSIRGFLRI